MYFPTQKSIEEKKKINSGNSLAVHWLRLHDSTAGGAGSIPGQGTKIPHVCGVAKKKKSIENSLQGRSYYYSHLTDEEVEPQRKGDAVCSLVAYMWWSWGHS